MLIPLAYRAAELNEPHPIITDPGSQRILEILDYPFENISNDWTAQVGISIRTHLIDNLVNQFVSQSPQPLIINIGCGLDTRRVRLGLDNIPWIDLDVPEVIEIRKRFFNESNTYKMIAKSMLDNTWMNDVKKFEFYRQYMDVLIIFEGVLMYFDKETITNLLSEIKRQFNHRELMFVIEFCSKLIAKNTHRHKSVSKLESKPQFKFGYNKLSEIFGILPKNMYIQSEYNYFDYFKNRWGLFGNFRYIPYLKNRFNNKILVIQNMAKN